MQCSLLTKNVAELALRHRLPAATVPRSFAEVGGLMSYSYAESDALRRSAFFAIKILQGGKPADMPVEQQPVCPLETALAVAILGRRPQLGELLVRVHEVRKNPAAFSKYTVEFATRRVEDFIKLDAEGTRTENSESITESPVGRSGRRCIRRSRRERGRHQALLAVDGGIAEAQMSGPCGSGGIDVPNEYGRQESDPQRLLRLGQCQGFARKGSREIRVRGQTSWEQTAT